MSEKAKDPEIIDKNISHKPIDYEKLNRLSEDFRERFTPQQEMYVEQAFWLRISNPTTIVPGMFKLDLEPLAPRLLQNREMHIEYLKYAQEQADILRGIVEQAKAKNL
ncbi:hypothetical protein Tco_0585064 [Tanacetum coccineum]